MRRMSLFLTLLMVIAPMTAMMTALDDTSPRQESYTATDGWGESLAYDNINQEGLSWSVLPFRGVSDWAQSEVANFSDSVEEVDVAIGPDQVIKACGYNADTQSLDVFTLSPDGTTTQTTVDSTGNVGRGCSIIIDYRGFARVAYLDVDASSLKIVRENDYTPATGDDWLLRTLVNDVNITSAPDVAIYSNGSIAIAYRDADTGGIHLMRFTGSWWRHTELVSQGAAEDMVLNIDVNDILHLSFVDTINERVAVISLDQDERTFSVVDEGVGIGQPLGHHLDATTRAQLVYGIDNGTGLRIVRDLSGRDDGRISPTPLAIIESNESTEFGTGADATGDYNSDGYSDLVYGEPGAGNDTGAIHVHYGGINGYSSTPDVSIMGTHPDARFGASLALVDDVNGDGYDDLLVGAPGEQDSSLNFTGAVHLFTGFPTGLSSTATWTKFGDTNDGQFGSRVAAAGDVDGNGFADVIVSEIGWVGMDNGKGRVHIFYGDTIISPISTTIVGHEDDLNLGWSITGVGDANGDGYADIVIGSSRAQIDVSGRGRAQAHYGGLTGINSTANRVWSMDTQWTLFGHTVNELGDIDNDGFDDLAVSEIFNNSVWIFRGGASGFSQNPYHILSGSNQMGYSMVPGGDVNDDGIQDYLVGTPGSGSSGGTMKLFPGTNSTEIFEATSPFYTATGASNQHLGRILSSGGDADRDGTHEFLYASTTSNSDGNPGGSIIIVETRDWELSDLPFDFTVNSLDLAVDAQGRTQLLLDTDEGYYHYERANELLTSIAPWGMNDFGSIPSAAMVVSPAGQPTIVTSDGVGIDFNRAEGGIFVSNLITSAGGQHGAVSAPIPNRTMAVFMQNSCNGCIIFSNQTGSGKVASVLATGVDVQEDIQLLVNQSNTPHAIWRNNATNNIILAVQNGSVWDESVLSSDANGSQFGAVMADNGSIGLMYRHDTSGLITEWLEGAANSWSMTERTVLSNNETLVDGEAAVQLSGSALEVVWKDNNSQWRHQFSESGSVTNQSLPSFGWMPQFGSPEFTTVGVLIPGTLVNTTGSHVLIDSTGTRTVDLDCRYTNDITLLADALGQDWVICPNPTGSLSINTLGGHQPIEFGSIPWQSDYAPAATIDANGTWHILHTNGYVIHRLADADRDFIPDVIDDLPHLGGQWTDSDGDGYGENPDAPGFDSCTSNPGSSAYGYYGCVDGDGDGFANAIDQCANAGKSWRDTLGCPDADGDGWSDPTGDAGWNGDRHPTNWMQAIDTDGDGRYDNHGPDCCGQNAQSDEFPLDPQQWIDADGDGWGDNSSAPTGDKCPGLLGLSIYDRGGCLDSDGDGWSDPEDPSTQNPEGWSYNRNSCVNNGTHCADLWPWAPDDTSPENVCGTRCNEQWGDRDGDGYGDNDSSDAWRRDAFPDDPTQHADTDSDGFGDNPIPAQNPDDCPVIWGNSTADKNGCPDTDGDGHSNDYTYDTNTTTGLRENELGDALPDDPEQWRDRDGDGFG
ncbi:MAG: hypothetical protein QGF94_04120, partial [Candidatus Thalassarchaeaceae archaeon]|nr:hypothetical protein [Candidatus Thalassarchaeaceae archaeon]